MQTIDTAPDIVSSLGSMLRQLGLLQLDLTIYLFSINSIPGANLDIASWKAAASASVFS